MKILFDAKLMQPGCVLLAAAYKTDRHIVDRFNTRTWLTSPTPDLGIYEITPEQLDILVKKVEQHHATRESDNGK